MKITKYITEFKDFVKELNGDLSGCDLRKTLLKKKDIIKYKIDENTLFPVLKTYTSYEVIKKYEYNLDNKNDNYFFVKQCWYNNQILVYTDEKKFSYFCNFVHFLKNDLSNADLLMCENLENIINIKNLNLSNIRVRSEIAKKLNLKINSYLKEKYLPVSFNEVMKQEIAKLPENSIERISDDKNMDTIAYVTDVHMLHRYLAWKCETDDDIQYVNTKIIKEIKNDTSKIKLIGGDISSDFDTYQKLIQGLAFNHCKEYFLTLGNHELWPFEGENLDFIIKEYKTLLSKNFMHLVHNNLYYIEEIFNSFWVREIKTNELETISDKDLKERVKHAGLIIFGGIGFAGQNEKFNANQGIYKSVLNRKEEIEESLKFETLYRKVSRTLYDKNVIIFTHMPFSDWLSDNNPTDKFIYIYGHNHQNYFYDDGIKRIYADNQIGYKQKEVSLKHLSISMDYDWFSDYKDGIYEIERDDYFNFYRGIRHIITFNRQFKKLYMLKREGTYMFIMETMKGDLRILSGGNGKELSKHPIEYFYDKLLSYSKSIKMFLSGYNEFQKKVAYEIKNIGGNGNIHGCIIDIDFYNHLYINPLDKKITPYFANSMTDKYVYNNVLSLLKYKCPKIYDNFEQKYLMNNKNSTLLPISNDYQLTKDTIWVNSTEIYKMSRIFKNLQYTIKYNIVRLWNENFVKEESVENGRLIVSNIIETNIKK